MCTYCAPDEPIQCPAMALVSSHAGRQTSGFELRMLSIVVWMIWWGIEFVDSGQGGGRRGDVNEVLHRRVSAWAL
jgi:hypothetical protein